MTKHRNVLKIVSERGDEVQFSGEGRRNSRRFAAVKFQIIFKVTLVIERNVVKDDSEMEFYSEKQQSFDVPRFLEFEEIYARCPYKIKSSL